MAKRTRYPNRTTAKPAAKRAPRPNVLERQTGVPASRPAPAPEAFEPDDVGEQPIRASSSGLTDAEMQRAEELEAEATAKEKAAIAESLRRRQRAATADEPRGAWSDVNAPLSVRAAHEYAYVARDVRRIAVTAGLMVAILAVLHILVNVLGVFSIV